MKQSAALFLAGLVMTVGVCEAGAGEPNTLSEGEARAGWRLLFDGKVGEQWRGFGRETMPERGWKVEDGWLKKVGGVRGGDLISRDTYGDFEFSWEWKISPGGNNGVKYFILEERGAIGHEYQMLDDPGRMGKGSTAAFYDVLPPERKKPQRPAGGVNHSRIVVRGDRVEHWLNGVKVLDYRCGSPEVKRAVARSKFRNVEGFGGKVRGHLVLTDHKDECWFRNLKIRE